MFIRVGEAQKLVLAGGASQGQTTAATTGIAVRLPQSPAS